jgi:TetR/AcrR family transcriptional regulator, transcriptional repressor of bet genes
MSVNRHLTAKGARSSARVLQAATSILARDGYGGATLGRIADQAGLDKRNVLYYYGSREALLVEVVQTVGERVAEHIDAAVGDPSDPQELASTLVNAMWSGITAAPELARAYFALIGGGAGMPVVDEALRDLKASYLEIIRRGLLSIAGTGWELRGDPDGMATLALAALRGLLLEWTETGDTPSISASLERCEELIAAQFLRRP